MQIDYRVSRTPRYLGVCGISRRYSLPTDRLEVIAPSSNFPMLARRRNDNFIIAKRTKGSVFGFRINLEVIAPSSDFQEGEM